MGPKKGQTQQDSTRTESVPEKKDTVKHSKTTERSGHNVEFKNERTQQDSTRFESVPAKKDTVKNSKTPERSGNNVEFKNEMTQQDSTRNESVPEKKDTGKYENIEIKCGFGGYYPLFLQPFARVECFTFFYGCSYQLTSTITFYIQSQITTMERQFGFSSVQNGLIIAANEIGFLLIVLFASYTAPYMHAPRSLGIAISLFAVAGVMCSMPFFIFREEIGNLMDLNVEASTSGGGSNVNGDLCTINSNLSSMCDNSGETQSKDRSVLPAEIVTASLVIIVIGMVLQGCAKSPRNSLVKTYIDNNTKSIGIHYGILSAMAVTGPGLAYLMGAVFSNIHVTLGETKLNQRHPKWVGAWWLGFLVCGGLAFVLSVPLLFFPRRLPRRSLHVVPVDENTERYKDGRPLMPKVQEDTGEGVDETGKSSILHHARSFLSSFSRLMTNWVFVCTLISTSFEVFGFIGMNVFMPKYLEEVFDMPPSKANYIMAGRSIFGGVVGVLVGGYLTVRLKMNTRSLLLLTSISTLLSLVCELFGLVFYCEQPNIHNWPGTEESCSGSCGCKENSFFAICGSDDKTYYSPCTAGCVNITSGMFGNCTCIEADGVAHRGFCPYGCRFLYLYLISNTTRVLLLSLSIVPRMLIFLGCVLPKDKGLSIGLATFYQSLCGWIGGPVVFGYIVDGFCSVWDVNNCDGTVGRCLHYDNSMFRFKIHAFSGCSTALCVIFLIVALIYARRTGYLEPIADSHVNNGNIQVTVETKRENGTKKPDKNESHTDTVL